MIKKFPTFVHIMYSGMGGAASIVFSLIDSEISNKSRQKVIFLGENLLSYYKNFCKKKKINFLFVKKKRFDDYLKTIFLIFKKIKLFKPEIIFIHDFSIIPCFFYKFFYKKTKLIFINHTTLKSNNFWKIKLACKLLFFLDAFVVLNKEDYNSIVKKNKFYSKKIFLIENGININYFSRKIKKNKNKNKNFKIGMACRVDGSRPYKLIAQSLLDPLIKNLNIVFSLCGDGSDFSKFKNYLYKNNLRKKVILEKFLQNKKLKKWFSSLDLYIQASFGEGMSTSVLQAMSMKIPVIGSKVPGLGDFLKYNKKSGIVFNNNIKDLAKCIYLFYKMNIIKKKKYINNKYKNIVSNYSNLHMNKKYNSLIEKIS